MNIEIINTGTELMLGRILNTHQQWLCRQLADHGYTVSRQTAVPDAGEDIQEAVRDALSRAELVVVTGGLGPTSDDLTRDKIAALLGARLRLAPKAMANLERFFAARNRPVPERARVQGYAPQGAVVLDNPSGTAPGLVMKIPAGRFRPRAGRKAPCWLVMLPGPPRELRPMFLDRVLPLIRQILPPREEFLCRTLRSTGIPESLMEQLVTPRLQSLIARGLDLGFCARNGEVDVRLAARGPGARRVVANAVERVRREAGPFVFGEDDETLEQVIVRLLTRRKKTLALAESCTGGFVAHRVTNVPGASAVLLAGWVTYDNEAKRRLLGVRATTLARHGAVSESVAKEMAAGARRRSGADYAVAVTGIAGPTGGSEDKPVGTVFLAIAGGGTARVVRQFNPLDRETFKYVTAQQGLEMIRRRVLGLEGAVLPGAVR